MKTKIFTLLVAAGCMTVASCESQGPDDPKDAAHEENQEKFDRDMKADYKFAETAADDGLLEVQLAELARTNASSQDVKDFAENMITDHSAANAELEQLASSKNISIPASLSENNQEKYGRLAKLNGKKFDEAYGDMMVKAHRSAIALFEKEAENGNDPELSEWAQSKLPVLRHHLEMAETLEEKTD